MLKRYILIQPGRLYTHIPTHKRELLKIKAIKEELGWQKLDKSTFERTTYFIYYNKRKGRKMMTHCAHVSELVFFLFSDL